MLASVGTRQTLRHDEEGSRLTAPLPHTRPAGLVGPEEGVVRHGGSVDERRDRMSQPQTSFCMQSRQPVVRREGPFLDRSGHGVILITVWGPFGIMSTLYTRSISLVSGFRSACVTTSLNSGSSPRAFTRLSRSSRDGYPRM
jgi:hypothetical protein